MTLRILVQIFIFHVLLLTDIAWALGSMSSIAASYGNNPIICAIEATHEQGVLCWGSTNSSSTGEQLPISIPPLMGLSGGSSFICGLRSEDQRAFCFSTNLTNASSSGGVLMASNVVPLEFSGNRYVSIAAGEFRTCALRASSENVSIVDCWGGSVDLRPPDLPGDIVSVISGRTFVCALRRTGECICWDETPSTPVNSVPPSAFRSVTAAGDHVCGIDGVSGEAVCWGNEDFGRLRAPAGVPFAFLAAGLDHTCGIRRDTHAIECWGNIPAADDIFPRRTAFLVAASGDGVTCGIREWNLLAECRNVRLNSNSISGEFFAPPLELLSPGLCTKADSCGIGEFTFNASNHGVPIDSTIRNELCETGFRICSPCSTICPEGSFLASECRVDEDVICVECGLCATAECEEWCKNASILSEEISKSKISIVIVISVSAGFLFVVLVAVVHRRFVDRRRKKIKDSSIHSITMETFAMSSSVASMKEPDFSTDYQVQAFRFSELRDATNGFKEFNEIGRGSYGIVHKATILPEGTQFAVKRASAARRIECSNKAFEKELEVLTKTRHANLVNLVGYCDQMGERLLVYEFMHNGSLHDHLHEEHDHAACPIANNWINRLSIASQAARAIEFLHSSKVVHGNVKCANVMIDREWKARVADFAIISNVHRGSKEGDTYGFGLVLLEIVTGKKNAPSDPPLNLIDWAVPLVKSQKMAEVLDTRCSSNISSMSQVAKIAVSCLANRQSRPSMAEVAKSLEELLESCQQHHHHHQHSQESTTTTCINFRDRLYLH